MKYIPTILVLLLISCRYESKKIIMYEWHSINYDRSMTDYKLASIDSLICNEYYSKSFSNKLMFEFNLKCNCGFMTKNNHFDIILNNDLFRVINTHEIFVIDSGINSDTLMYLKLFSRGHRNVYEIVFSNYYGVVAYTMNNYRRYFFLEKILYQNCKGIISEKIINSYRHLYFFNNWKESQLEEPPP